MSDQSSQNSSKSRKKRASRARSVTEILGSVLEPILARRAGMKLDLIRAWPELAGQDYANSTRPEKINWPRRINEEDPFKAGTLIVACEPSAAVFFEHEKAILIERVNVFFGFEAINRLKILQKPVAKVTEGAKPNPAPISAEDNTRLQELLDEIDDPELKETLGRLGTGVLGSK